MYLLAEIFLHAIAAGPCRSVVHQMRQHYMSLMAAILAILADPYSKLSLSNKLTVGAACLAREVVKGLIRVLIVVECHAFKRFVRDE